MNFLQQDISCRQEIGVHVTAMHRVPCHQKDGMVFSDMFVRKYTHYPCICLPFVTIILHHPRIS